MVFSSNVFLFLFLPIFLGLYYLCPNRGRNLLILIGSYTFYAWWPVSYTHLDVYKRQMGTPSSTSSGSAPARI